METGHSIHIVVSTQRSKLSIPQRSSSLADQRWPSEWCESAQKFQSYQSTIDCLNSESTQKSCPIQFKTKRRQRASMPFLRSQDGLWTKNSKWSSEDPPSDIKIQFKCFWREASRNVSNQRLIPPIVGHRRMMDLRWEEPIYRPCDCLVARLPKLTFKADFRSRLLAVQRCAEPIEQQATKPFGVVFSPR